MNNEKRYKNLFTVKNIIIINNAIDHYLEYCKNKATETKKLIPDSCAETEIKLQNSLKFYNRNIKELEELLDTIENLDYSKIDK